MGHVLIVEDNSDIGTLYTRALFSHEHTIVRNAEAALELLKDNHYDLIILDMHLPNKPGIEVLKHIRHNLQDKDTPVFAISADDLMRQPCEEIGIQAWMTKPIELDKLMEKAAELLPVSKS